MPENGVLQWISAAAAVAGGICCVYLFMRAHFAKRDIPVTILDKRNPHDREPAHPAHPTYAVDVSYQGQTKTFYCDRNLFHRLPVNAEVTIILKGKVILGFHEKKETNTCHLE